MHAIDRAAAAAVREPIAAEFIDRFAKRLPYCVLRCARSLIPLHGGSTPEAIGSIYAARAKNVQPLRERAITASRATATILFRAVCYLGTSSI